MYEIALNIDSKVVPLTLCVVVPPLLTAEAGFLCRRLPIDLSIDLKHRTRFCISSVRDLRLKSEFRIDLRATPCFIVCAKIVFTSKIHTLRLWKKKLCESYSVRGKKCVICGWHPELYAWQKVISKWRIGFADAKLHKTIIHTHALKCPGMNHFWKCFILLSHWSHWRYYEDPQSQVDTPRTAFSKM